MTRTALVPLDGSPRAEGAVPYAALLAREGMRRATGLCGRVPGVCHLRAPLWRPRRLRVPFDGTTGTFPCGEASIERPRVVAALAEEDGRPFTARVAAVAHRAVRHHRAVDG